MDGADDGAAGVDGVAHCAHHDGGRPRIQATCRLILHSSRISLGHKTYSILAPPHGTVAEALVQASLLCNYDPENGLE